MNTYSTIVDFDKTMVRGILKGMHIPGERMGFLSWDDACAWATAVNRINKADYIVAEMRGPNGEVKNFERFAKKD